MKNCNPLKLYCFALLTFFATMASGQVTIGSPGPNATITCDATPTFTTPTASSSCSGVTVNELSSITSGNTCQTVITKSWEATDDCGNTSATVSQKITIVDIVAPAIGPAGESRQACARGRRGSSGRGRPCLPGTPGNRAGRSEVFTLILPKI